MKLWFRRFSHNEPPSANHDADLTTSLVALACLAAAALETCDEVHQHSHRADSPTSKHFISDR